MAMQKIIKISYTYFPIGGKYFKCRNHKKAVFFRFAAYDSQVAVPLILKIIDSIFFK